MRRVRGGLLGAKAGKHYLPMSLTDLANRSASFSSAAATFFSPVSASSGAARKSPAAAMRPLLPVRG